MAGLADFARINQFSDFFSFWAFDRNRLFSLAALYRRQSAPCNSVQRRAVPGRQLRAIPCTGAGWHHGFPSFSYAFLFFSSAFLHLKKQKEKITSTPPQSAVCNSTFYFSLLLSLSCAFLLGSTLFLGNLAQDALGLHEPLHS
jgi:hypothetical protein